MTEKYTIPGGYDFSQPTPESVAFFAWLAHNQVNPEMINAKEQVVLAQDDITWRISATTTDGGIGTWPLGTPTAPVVGWLKEEFGVRSTPLDGVKDRMDKLADARAREKAAKEEAEELRAEILGILAAQRATVGTVDGKPFIMAKKVPMPGKFNRKGFEAAYPVLAELYTGAAYDQTRLEFL